MATKVNDIFVTVGGSAQGLLNELGKGIKSIGEFKTKALSMAAPYAGAATALAAAAGIATAAIVAMTKQGLDVIDQQSKAAKNLGLTTEQMTGLAHAASLADVSFEGLSGALSKLGINLANAEKETGDALGKIGLSLDDLRSGDVGTAFTKIVTGLSKVESVAERAAIAQKLMGKGAKEVMGLINGGPEELAKMTDEAKRLGLTFSSIDGQKVEAANDAISDVFNAIQGLSNTMAVEFAPAIKAVADLTTEWLTDARKGAKEFLPDLESLTIAAALFADVGAVIAQGTWLAALGTFNAISQTFAAIGTAFAEITGIGNEYFEQMQKNADNSAEAFTKAWNNFKLPHDKIFAQFDKVKEDFASLDEIKPPKIGEMLANDIEKDMEKATESAHKYVERLKREISVLQIGEAATQRQEFANQGVDAALLEESRILAEQLETVKKIHDEEKKRAEDIANKAKEDKKKLAEDAKSLSESLMTPIEKAQKRFEELEQMLSEGLISTEEFTKAANKNRGELGKDQEKRFASVALKGSQEARDIVLKARGGPDKMTNLAQRQLLAQQEMAVGIKKLVTKAEATNNREVINNI